MRKKFVLLLIVFCQHFCLFSQIDENKDVIYNTTNLDKVLLHYSKTKEKEKYNAAKFLINNIIIQKSIDYEWVKRNGTVFEFSEFEYPDYLTAYKKLFSIKDSIGLYPKRVITSDKNKLTAHLLIKNIDDAFLKWKNNPWSQSYSFEIFCEYILPYRSLTEPLEDWRKDYELLASRKKYRIEDDTNPVEVCTQILSNLQNFTFVSRRIDPIPLLSPKQMLFREQGSCPDLANFALLINRAVGIAVTFDYTPHFAASSNRHYWNTVIDKKGNHIPFNSNSVNESDASLPYIYNATRKRLGKVYRKTFSIQSKSLSNFIEENKIPKGFLRQKNNLDVTSEYVETTTLKINKKRFINTIGYINVFNHDKWRVIGWGSVKNSHMTFENLGRDIVYLPSIYKKGEMVYQKYPYLINREGKIKELIPDKEKTFSATLSRSNEEEVKYIDFNTLDIISDEKYTLYYWDNRWRLIDIATASEEGVFFENIPSNALYKMLPKSPDKFERVFTVDAQTNKITWF